MTHVQYQYVLAGGDVAFFVGAQWGRTAKNWDVGTGPLAPHYSLCSRAPLRTLVRSLAHFAHSLARGKVNY